MRTGGAILGFVKGSVRLTVNRKHCEITLHIKNGLYRNEKLTNLHKIVRDIFIGLKRSFPNVVYGNM